MRAFQRASTYLWLFFAALFLVSAHSVAIEVLGLSGQVVERPGTASSVDVDYQRNSRQQVTTTHYSHTFTDESGATYTPSLDRVPSDVREGDTVTLGFVKDTLTTVNGTLVNGVTPLMSVVFGTATCVLVFALFMGKVERGRAPGKNVSTGTALGFALFLLLPAVAVGFVTLMISALGKDFAFAPWPLCMIACALGLGFFLRWRVGRRASR